MQRGDDDAWNEQRFGERQRVSLGIEHIGVEEMRRRARQLMRDPRQHPRHHQRIPVVVHAVGQVEDLRVRHHGGQDREEEQHGEEKAFGGDHV